MFAVYGGINQETGGIENLWQDSSRLTGLLSLLATLTQGRAA